MGDLKIVVTAFLNETLSKKQLQDQLDKISKDLKINVSIDPNQIKQLDTAIKQLQNKINSGQNQGLKIKPEVDASQFKEVYTSIDKAIAHYKELGSVKITNTSINPLNDQVQKFTLSVTNAYGVVEKLKFELASLKGVQGLPQGSVVLSSKSSTDNTQTILDRQLQQEQAINKTVEQRRQALQQQLELYKRQAEIQANALLNNQRKILTPEQQTGLQTYLAQVRELNSSTPQIQQRMRQLSLDYREISANAQTASHHTQTFGNMLKQAFEKFPIWMLATTAFFAPIRAIQDMTQRLIDIDTAMVQIKRVMDQPDYKFVDMLQSAVDTSDQLSSKLTDVLSIMGGFGRMGFDNSQLVDITKTAQVLQNISDLDQNSSVDTLTSAMLNFNIAAKDSLTISDKLNEVD